MAFKVDSGQSGVGLNRNTRVSIRTPEDSEQGLVRRKLLAGAPEDPSADALKFDPSEANEPRSIGLVTRTLEMAAEAVAAVETQRMRELDLAEEAKNLSSQTPRHNTIGIEQTRITTEIGRILAAATYGGQSVLSARSYDLDSGLKGVQNGASVGAFASLSGKSSSLITSTGAATAYQTIERDLTTLRSYKAGVNAAAAKAENLLDRAPPDTLAELGAGERADPLSVEDALSAAELVAAELTSPFADESQRASLVEMSAGKLDPDQATKLLAEEE